MKHSSWFGLMTLVAFGCGVPTPPKSEDQAKAPELPQKFKNRCDSAKTQLRPLVVEWEAPDRAALEAQALHGQLVVKYTGCELEVLRRCKAPPRFAYKYTAITPKDEVVTIKSADQLYATIPVHAFSFEGKLAESGELNAEMKIVGEYGAEGLPPSSDQLSGECTGATHVVTALTVGAFAFYAGAKREAGVKASALGAGAGADTSRSVDTLSRDGDVKACIASARGDAQPPQNCGALLRVELAAVLATGEGIPECGPGTRLVDKKCEPVPKPSELAPEDTTFVDERHGFGWGDRCFKHYKAGALAYARAACDKALESNPDAATRGAVLYNYALVEEASGDPVAACDKLARSQVVRDNAAVKKKLEALACKKSEKP
jgi:hypothetical protein